MDKQITSGDGSKLALRMLTRADAPDFSRYCGDPAVARNLGHALCPYPVLAAEGFIDISNASRATGRAFDYAITVEERFVGVTGLWRASEAWSLGYWIAKPFWGQGLATDAGALLLKAFDAAHPGGALTADTYTDNPASGRVLEKLGFTRTEEQGRGFNMARLKSFPTYIYRRNAGVGASKRDFRPAHAEAA